jgi:hypothetical protein
MKRQHPLFSLLSIGFSGVLLFGLAATIWLSGNTLFSPGRLSAKSLAGVQMDGFGSHDAFEAQCERCHQPLETTQDMLCTRCHTKVRDEMDRQEGIHGVIAGVTQCSRCHPDHRGRKFDPGMAALAKFDHSTTDFNLVRHQVNYDVTPIDCAACHSVESRFSTPVERCASCHAGHDQDFMLQHGLDYGMNCLDCHDGHDSAARFDHASAKFPLVGRHAAIRCADCHGKDGPGAKGGKAGMMLTIDTFRKTPGECVNCHTEPKIHRGLFDLNCAKCHSQEAWSPADWEGQAFEHASLTGFSLQRHAEDYAGEAIACQGCHTDTSFQTFDLQVCTACHGGETGGPQDEKKAEFMREHQEQFGAACLDCHDGVDRLSNFDHAQVFPLDGAHAEIDCADCHKEKVFRGTPQECSGCHAEPEIHAGVFGLQCQFCHTTQAWTPAKLQQHGFPLDHAGQGEVNCTTCHPGTYVEYTCYGCHEHQPEQIQEKHLEVGVTLEELPACVQCHPNGLKEESHE